MAKQTVFVALLIAVAGVVALVVNSAAHSKELAVGDRAPDFSNVEATHGKTVSLKDYRGKKLFLVFYPIDNTPGCTIQLCSLRDAYERYKSAGVEILASNPGSLASHDKFSKKQEYPFPIMVDEKKTISKAYGVMGPIGIQHRVVFLIDENGVIQYRHDGTQNNETVLNKAKSLGQAN
jgi:peroxiredoxin Q/BCP